MHRMSNLNKFKDSYQVLEKNPRFCHMSKKKVQGPIRNVKTIFFGSRFLPQTPFVLKCMNVTRTKCLLLQCKCFQKIKFLEILGH